MICLLGSDDLSDGDNVAFNILYTFLVAFNGLFASRVYIKYKQEVKGVCCFVLFFAKSRVHCN
jgi:hypothetical protein